MWSSRHYLQLDGGVTEDVSVTAECGWKWGGCVPCEDAAHLHRMTVTIIQTGITPGREDQAHAEELHAHPDRPRAGGGNLSAGDLRLLKPRLRDPSKRDSSHLLSQLQGEVGASWGVRSPETPTFYFSLEYSPVFGVLQP